MTWKLLCRMAVFTGCLAGSGMILAADTEPPASAAKPKAIIFYGVYTQWYKLDTAFSEFDLKIANAHSERVQDFPSVKTLFNAKFIILSDINGGEFTEGQIQQLKSYIEDGGAVLFLGGPFTYGLGQLKEKGLADLLPVEELQPFDLKWEKAGVSFDLTAAGEITRGLPAGNTPMAWWVHLLKPKADAQTVVKAGNYPLLILGRYGKGRVAVFTGTPMGVAGPGQMPFWEWDGWPILLRNTITWLTSAGATPVTGEVKP